MDTTSDRVVMDLGGRRMAAITPDERFTQPVPNVEFFRELAASMRQSSALLALSTEELVNKAPIYAAYAQDLAMLRRYHTEFQDCVRSAVRCSIGGITPGREQVWEEAWQLLAKQIPTTEQVQPLLLPHTLAARSVTELLAGLQTEMHAGVERTLRPLADWLQLLAESELIGVVEWSGVDVCCYSYFRHEFTKTVTTGKKRREHTFNDSQPWGQKNADWILRDKTIFMKQIQERHVHHIVDAKVHKIRDYPQPVPAYVAMFLDTVPSSLEPHLSVVEGMITMEERHWRLVAEGTHTDTDVLSVFKYSPGVLLGPFNLIGWNADDIASGGVFSLKQKAAKRKTGSAREHLRRATGHLFTA